MAKMYKTIAELMVGENITKEEATKLWVPGIKIPKLSHRWRISATGPLSDDNIALQVKSCERPIMEFEEIALPPNTEANPSNVTAYVAGKHSWLPVSIVLEDDARGDAARAIQAQMTKQMDCCISGSIDYKFDLHIDYLDGNNEVTDVWVMEGCFLQEINYNSLDYSSSDVVEMEIIVRYDHAQML